MMRGLLRGGRIPSESVAELTGIRENPPRQRLHWKPMSTKVLRNGNKRILVSYVKAT
jgi:hypothetical protein